VQRFCPLVTASVTIDRDDTPGAAFARMSELLLGVDELHARASLWLAEPARVRFD
jgi:hypothetical protein